MDDPNTTNQVTPDPNIQPGGQSYENIVQLQNTTANNLNSVQAQLDAANAQITSLQTPPPSPPPSQPTNDSVPDGDMFNFSDGMMRMDDGKINPLLVTTLDKIGIKGDMAANFVGHMENSVKYNTHLNNVTITETVGTQEKFDALLGWGKENMTPDAFAQVSQGLNNRDMMKYAVHDLMNQAQVGGFSFGDTPVAPSNEPTTLPASSGGTNVSTAPLVPNSPEAIAAFSDPRYRTDATYKAIVHQRLAAGTQLM